MAVICFAGPPNIFINKKKKDRLYNLCKKLASKYNAAEFWVSDEGAFDCTAANVILSLKQEICGIRLCMAVLNKQHINIKTNIKYDKIISADIDNKLSNKEKIIKYNEFVISNCDCLIVYNGNFILVESKNN